MPPKASNGTSRQGSRPASSLGTPAVKKAEPAKPAANDGIVVMRRRLPDGGSTTSPFAPPPPANHAPSFAKVSAAPAPESGPFSRLATAPAANGGLVVLRRKEPPPQPSAADLEAAAIAAAAALAGESDDSLWRRVMEAASSSDRSLAAATLANRVKTNGVFTLKDSGLLQKLKSAAEDTKSPLAREGAVVFISELCKSLGPLAEPYIVPMLPLILERCGDKLAPVRDAAEVAAKALIGVLCPHAVRVVLPVIFEGMACRKNWRTQEASTQLLASMAERAPKQMAASLPAIVPVLTEHMIDGKEQVMKVAYATMEVMGSIVGNRDIAEFVPALISCIARPGEVPECIQQLSGTTFVQAVTSGALAFMVPLLVRGLKERATPIKRKTAVIIDNMSKLVDDPADAAPFLPLLMPGLEKVGKDVADPECRQVATKAHATLANIESHVEAPSAALPAADPKVARTLLTETLKPVLGETPDDYLLPCVLEYVSALTSQLVTSKKFEIEDWSECFGPYLEPFLPAGTDMRAQCKAFLVRCAGKTDEAQDSEEEDDEGEVLCNCEFSLGYGGKILLNSTRLRLKRGRRYGLCGANGAGKSTLMRAISRGQLEGFPSPDVLRTVYVEHDLDSSVAEMPVLELMCNDPKLKGIPQAEIEQVLSSVGFSAEMQQLPIMSLSGGWKMKLALARAMLMRADILLLDEPTNHLDTANVEWLENYLVNLKDVSSMIVSHDSGFLDIVCTDIIHYERRKLKQYKGNLAEFVKVKPEARVYYDLSAVVNLKFTFPEPPPLDGIRSREKPILKLTKVGFAYPGTGKKQLSNVNISATLASRVAITGVNGAGKSTLVKLMTGEVKAQEGNVWKHQNLRVAYVAQHAFHHVEQHLEKSPNEYIQWRFEKGEDKEEEQKVTRKVDKEELEAMAKELYHEGKQKVLQTILNRRIKRKGMYEYEVQWVGLPPPFNTWLTREMLDSMGFAKLVNEMNAREVARAGFFTRPLTTDGIQRHLDNFGLEPEFGTYGQIRNLSGGQKVKVVLAAAMWNNPHLLVLDEPTNYLDRDSLGALVGAIREWGGSVIMISHNSEFTSQLCPEQWRVADGKVTVTGRPTIAVLEAARRK